MKRLTIPHRKTQQGSVAIIVGLSLFMLVGFAGLALDLGRLYINRTELQTAADACALAAASELVCDTRVVAICPASYLQNAENAGRFAAARNRVDFQATAVAIAAGDIRFSMTLGPNSSYATRAGANPNSKYAMCTARSNGIVPWFMSVLGIGATDVTATAVATLEAGQNFCNALPIGVCGKSGASAPNFGYAVGEWISSQFSSANSSENLAGSFKWVDFTPNAGGNAEIRDQLAGDGSVCNLRVGDQVQQPGQQQGAKSAYNTRFGLYPNGANAYTPQSAAPDRSGYAYPNQAPGSPVIAIGTSAYADYVSRQASHTPFTSNQYGVSGPGGNISGSPLTSAEHQTYGSERRLVVAPFIDCNAGNTVPMVGLACLLMLNPMSNGASGTLYVEYRGSASDAASPCRSAGLPGGGGGSAAQVSTLVQ